MSVGLAPASAGVPGGPTAIGQVVTLRSLLTPFIPIRSAYRMVGIALRVRSGGQGHRLGAVEDVGGSPGLLGLRQAGAVQPLLRRPPLLRHRTPAGCWDNGTAPGLHKGPGPLSRRRHSGSAQGHDRPSGVSKRSAGSRRAAAMAISGLRVRRRAADNDTLRERPQAASRAVQLLRPEWRTFRNDCS